MKIYNVNSNISFKRANTENNPFIEAHAHTGRLKSNDYVSGTKSDLTPLKDSFEISSNGKVQKWLASDIFVSDLECLGEYIDKDGMVKSPRTEFEGNELMLKKFGLIPSNQIQGFEPNTIDNKIRLLAVCQPGRGNPAEIDKLMQNYDNKFYGFKFHPYDFKTSVDNYAAYKPYMELAQKYKKPSLFHVGGIIDNNGKFCQYSNPYNMYEFAKKLKADGIKIPIIMGHMGIGGAESNRAGLNILLQSIQNNDAVLYADTSWVDEGVIIESLKRLKNETKNGMGLSRLLFGTDAPLGIQKETERPQYIARIQRIQDAIRQDAELAPSADSIIEKLFYKNAKNLLLKGKNSLNQKLAETAKMLLRA